MAPRNNDQIKCEDTDDFKEIVPCILHKKHKVIKLIKSHLNNVKQEGVFSQDEGYHLEGFQRQLRAAGYSSEGEAVDMNSENRGNNGNRRNKRVTYCATFILFLLLIFLLILIMIWISAGPLSNSIPHTPIPCRSFVRTDYLCSLEKKYLLRWSKPEYFG